MRARQWLNIYASRCKKRVPCFKLPHESGNWYGTDFIVSEAEARPQRPPIYEFSLLKQDIPVWNMHKPPEDSARPSTTTATS